jgi:hypothetical protein
MTNLPLELKHDTTPETTFDIEDDEGDCPKIEMIEIPVVKRMVFQFKKPVELEFSWGSSNGS